MSSLKATLTDLSQSLVSHLDSLEDYRCLDPRINLFVQCVGMLSTMGTELEHAADDILSQLSGIPDSFTDLLNDVNLLVGSKDNIVIISIMERDRYPPKVLHTIEDSNFITALLKVYEYMQTDTVERPVYYSTRVSSLVTALGKRMIFNNVEGSSICFESQHRITEHALEDLEKDFEVEGLCKVLSVNDEYIEIEWLKPFFGKISILGNYTGEI